MQDPPLNPLFSAFPWEPLPPKSPHLHYEDLLFPLRLAKLHTSVPSPHHAYSLTSYSPSTLSCAHLRLEPHFPTQPQVGPFHPSSPAHFHSKPRPRGSSSLLLLRPRHHEARLLPTKSPAGLPAPPQVGSGTEAPSTGLLCPSPLSLKGAAWGTRGGSRSGGTHSRASPPRSFAAGVLEPWGGPRRPGKSVGFSL